MLSDSRLIRKEKRMRIDAHCHTNCSDGNITIEERIALILSSGLDAATITDHDFISTEQVALARQYCQGIPYIPGIELSLQYQNKVVHLLGYFIDPENHGLQRHISNVQEHDIAITKKLISYYRDRYHSNLTLEELKIDSLHTFYSMSFIKKVASASFGNDSKKSLAAFQSAEADLGMKYAHFSPWDVRSAIELVHAAGGIAVLAHPGGESDAMMQTLGFLLHEKTHIREYVDWGLDGIETGTPVHTADETLFYAGLCREYNLLSTAGSDCHGDDPYLGPATMGVFTEFADDSYEAMCEYHQQRRL